MFPCWYGIPQMALSHRAAKSMVEYGATHDDYVRCYARTAHS
jgi:hypothetical protein